MARVLKTAVLNIRLSAEERARIDAMAAKTNQKPSAFGRFALLKVLGVLEQQISQ